MKKFYKILLKCIYIPIGGLSDVLDFIAGKICEHEEKIK